MNTVHRTLLFLVESDNILLALKKRGYGEGRWNGVGGKVEQGETIQQAMIRECQEEIMVRPEDFEAAGQIEFLRQDGSTEGIVHLYIASAWDGEPLESEEMAPHWFKISEIPYDRMWPADELWLPEVLQGKFIRGSFTFDEQEKLLDYHIREIR